MPVHRRASDGTNVARKLLAAALLLLCWPRPAFGVAREMPPFGHLHDDSIYWVSAKSLAEGRGCRILSMPGELYQTRYPPLWPLVLAAILENRATIPGNLKLGTVLACG